MGNVSPEQRVRTLLRSLYGREAAARCWRRLSTRPRSRAPERPLTARDNLLITYGDQVTEPGRAPLETLSEFVERHAGDVITGVHLLPHYPYSSDDGFSVIDHRRVDPALGTWADVRRLGRRFRLMLDAVVNHVSRRSPWFAAYRRGAPRCADHFIECDPSADLSAVVRPRALPLLTPVATARGTRHLWTTFSDDQIDLNYRDPDVLMEMLDILLGCAARGAALLRLDAVAYLWKEIGTPCIHLAQTHRIVRLMRAVFDLIRPGTMLVAEVNASQRDNLAYLGDGTEEAHLVYNFALPPLVLHTLRTGNASALTCWAAQLPAPPPGTTLLNFLASHDGIGLNPARGLLSETEIADLTTAGGGLVSRAHGPGGSSIPYELNANYLDALGGRLGPFLVAQAILLALRGLPGIYFHSLFGSRGWPAGVRRTGRNRTVNRRKFTRHALERELAAPSSVRARVLRGWRTLLRARARSDAFDPQAPQRVLECGEGVFGLERVSRDGRRRVFCLHNVGARPREVGLDKCARPLHDLIRERDVLDSSPLRLSPHEVLWLAADP